MLMLIFGKAIFASYQDSKNSQHNYQSRNNRDMDFQGPVYIHQILVCVNHKNTPEKPVSKLTCDMQYRKKSLLDCPLKKRMDN